MKTIDEWVFENEKKVIEVQQSGMPFDGHAWTRSLVARIQADALEEKRTRLVCAALPAVIATYGHLPLKVNAANIAEDAIVIADVALAAMNPKERT